MLPMGFSQFEAPIFNDRVGQKAITEQLYLGLGCGAIGGLELHVDRLANSQGFDAVNTQTGCGSTGGLPGGVEHRRPEGDLNVGAKERHLGSQWFVKS